MKAYAFDPEGTKNDVGCCPGHDWPQLRHFAGTRNSPSSRRAATKRNKVAKRNRRHRDKQRLQDAREI